MLVPGNVGCLAHLSERKREIKLVGNHTIPQKGSGHCPLQGEVGGSTEQHGTTPNGPVVVAASDDTREERWQTVDSLARALDHLPPGPAPPARQL